MENIVKRERSTNFSKSEVRLLTELVANHRTIIENKKTDAVNNKEKEAAWNKIALLFNAASGVTARSTKSLKGKYESIKKETKKSMAKHRQQLYKTGGGPSSAPDFTDIEENVMAICSNITGLDARNDSDNIPEPQCLTLETARVVLEELPLPTSNNSPLGEGKDDYYLPILKEDVQNVIENVSDEGPFLATPQTVQLQAVEVEDTQKENNWSSWTPKSLKTKISPGLKAVSIQKTSKAGVTAKLDQLTKARLELVALQKDIAMKEHEFVSEEHKFKMLSLQNDEKRKQEIHNLLEQQLRNGVNVQRNVTDFSK